MPDITLQFDNDSETIFGSMTEWRTLAKWVKGVDAPEVKSLFSEGCSDNLGALTEQLSDAHRRWAPTDTPTNRNVVKLLKALEESEANAVVVTDGTDEEPAEWQKSLAVVEQQNKALVQSQKETNATLTLLSKSLGDLAAKLTAPAPQPVMMMPPNMKLDIPEANVNFGGALEKMLSDYGAALIATTAKSAESIADALKNVQIVVQVNPTPIENIIQPAAIENHNHLPELPPANITVQLQRGPVRIEGKRDKDGNLKMETVRIVPE